MSDISKSKILPENLPEDFTKAVNEITDYNELLAYMHAAEDQVALQNGGVRDALDPNIVIMPTVPAAPAGGYVRTVGVGGKTYEFHGETDAEAQAKLNEFIAQTLGQKPVTEQQTQIQQEQPLELVYDPISRNYRDSKGRFVSDDVARNIIEGHEQEANESYRELQLEQEIKTKLLRGEISLTQAMDEAHIVEKAIDRREQQSWADATAAVLQEDGPLADWPGSPDGKLLDALGNKIQELGLDNASDRVAALAQAWEALKADAEAAQQETTDAEYQKELAQCTSRAEIDEVTRKYFAGRTKHGMDPNELAARGFWGQ